MDKAKRSVRANGERIRAARLARDWRTDELAKAAGYSKRTIENAESGNAVDAATLKDIADALNLDFESLCIRPDVGPRKNDTLRAKASIIVSANPDDPPTVNQVIDELIEMASLVDGVPIGTSRVDCSPLAPTGGLLINMTLTCRDAHKLARAIRNGNLRTLDVRLFEASDCWIWIFARPPVEPD